MASPSVPQRGKAILLLIADVDRHPAKYAFKDKRTQALEELALRCEPAPSFYRPKGFAEYTPRRFRGMVSGFKRCGRFAAGYVEDVETFWREGSKSLKPEYLESIGYPIEAVVSEKPTTATEDQSTPVTAVHHLASSQLTKNCGSLSTEERVASTALIEDSVSESSDRSDTGSVLGTPENVRTSASTARTNGEDMVIFTKCCLPPTPPTDGTNPLNLKSPAPSSVRARLENESAIERRRNKTLRLQSQSDNKQSDSRHRIEAAIRVCGSCHTSESDRTTAIGSCPTTRSSLSTIYPHSRTVVKRKRAMLAESIDENQPDSASNSQPTKRRTRTSEASSSSPSSPNPSFCQTSQPFADSTLFYLDEDSIRKQMDDVYNITVSCIYEEFSRPENQVKDSAFFVMGRSLDSGLLNMYKKLLSKSEFAKSKMEIHNRMSARDLGIALVGTFISVHVFDNSQTDIVAQDMISSVRNVLKCFGSKVEAALEPFRTNLDTILRRAYLAGVREAQFQNEKLAPIAVGLADELADSLDLHLAAGKGDGPDVRSRQATVMRVSPRLSDIIQRCLVLKCEMSSAREEYQHSRFEYGDDFDGRLMESTHDTGGTILTTVFPGLTVLRSGSKKAVCKARVRLRPREE